MVRNNEETSDSYNCKDPNMFVDDGYSSNEESAIEEQNKKEMKQCKLRELNRRRRHTLDDSNKLKEKNVKLSKALVAHKSGSIFSRRKDDDFLEDIRKESNKRFVNRSDGLPRADSKLKSSLDIKDLSNIGSKNSEREANKKENVLSEILPSESQSCIVKSIPSLGRKENYWTAELDSMWTETSLLLRVPITNAEDLIYVEASAEAGLLFMSELDDVAKSLNILRGTLSRWLLPYDQNTRLDEQSSTPHR